MTDAKPTPAHEPRTVWVCGGCRGVYYAERDANDCCDAGAGKAEFHPTGTAGRLRASEHAVETLTRGLAEAEVARLREAAELARLRKALAWYANEATWSNAKYDKLNAEGGFFYPYGLDECPIAKDKGKRARKALDGKEKGR